MKKFIALLVVVVIFLSLISLIILRYPFRQPKADNIVTSVITALTGSTKRTQNDTYVINGKNVEVVFSTDFKFKTTGFQHSTAFQDYLDSGEFDFTKFTVQKQFTSPKKITFRLTDKFKQTEWVAYNAYGEMIASYDYTYDIPNNTLQITITFNTPIWTMEMKGSDSFIPSRKLTMGTYILWSMAQLDKHYPSSTYAAKITGYLSSSIADQL